MSHQAPVPLLLMADYLADPNWTRSPSGADSGMVPLDRLPLDAELKGRLRAWAARFDELMDTGYEWPSRTEQIAWVSDGRVLLETLRQELGRGYDIQYHHDGRETASR